MTRFDVLAEVESEAVVRSLAPDLAAIAAFPARAVIVTSRADSPGFDFVSRFFGPRVGVPEDPVTGSAHCALGPYWAGKLGRSELVGYQASSRGGVVRVRVEGDRVLLGGQAVTVLRGELVDRARADAAVNSRAFDREESPLGRETGYNREIGGDACPSGATCEGRAIRRFRGRWRSTWGVAS